MVGLVILAGLIAACAGRRPEGKPEYDMMENLTARYNIVYHGRKLIADVERQQFETHRDNYQQLLPVLIDPTETSAASAAPLMDSVIGKARDLINRKTRSRYINEAYLLTGKANYLKGSYYNAAELFTYVAHAFADMPEYRQAALVWKARSLMRLGNLTAAADVLDTVFMGLDTEKRSVGLAFATQAQYYLLTHDEASAITMLEQALAHTSHKPTKLRWHFLLGQLLERQGQPEAAYAHYSRVVRSNAPYEMAFHAGLNRVYLATTGASGGDRVTLLRRMLRDGKNAEFKDQIYYRIGEVYYADGHVEEAIAQYERSLRQEGSNRYQTALTYLKLADHYFALAEYPRAKLYYDSVGMTLPPDFPDAGAVQRKIAHLDGLIAQLQTVAHEDSLQYLAGLPPEQRTALLDSLGAQEFAAIQQAAQPEKRAARRRVMPQTRFDEVFTADAAYTDNRFYFNNPDAIGMGQAAFRRRWGNRQLHDNWRFSDMATGISSATAAIAPTENAVAVEAATADTVAVDSIAWVRQWRETYETQVPQSAEDLVASNNRIHDAMVRIGDIYRDDLRDAEAAIVAYEALLERFPDSPSAALMYYNLYRLYAGVNDERAAHYRERLLNEFPDALYSRIVQDPDYLAKLEQERQVLNRVYDTVYTWYTEGRYGEVIDRVTDLMDREDRQPRTISQLAYLRTLALGRTGGLDTFETALQELVTRFPDDSLVTPLARQHLAFIEDNRDTLATRLVALEPTTEGRQRFVDEPTMTLWPQLVINRGPEPPRPRRQLAVGTAQQTGIGGRLDPGRVTAISGRQLAQTATVGDLGPNVFRNLELLPDTATYFFVINVMNGRVNLAPSRYGIGQFNRTRYAGAAINHQLKAVADENQLIYIGPFRTYAEAKLYETRILPLLPDIMKVPAEIYNTFVITETHFGTLSDFNRIADYHDIYQEEAIK